MRYIERLKLVLFTFLILYIGRGPKNCRIKYPIRSSIVRPNEKSLFL